VKLLAAAGLALVALAALALAGYRLLPAWYAESVPAAVARQVYPLEHEAAIREAATRHGVDPTLVAAVIYQESSFRETVVSASGAIGLMQVLPSTAEDIALRTGGERFETGDLRDPEINIRYGTELLRFLLDYYDDDVPTALAAYHAGPGNVDRWLRAAGADELELVAIPYADTRAYVERVGRLRTIYRRAWGAELGAPS
jgi:soluble lytic murein transglycosylase